MGGTPIRQHVRRVHRGLHSRRLPSPVRPIHHRVHLSLPRRHLRRAHRQVLQGPPPAPLPSSGPPRQRPNPRRIARPDGGSHQIRTYPPRHSHPCRASRAGWPPARRRCPGERRTGTARRRQGTTTCRSPTRALPPGSSAALAQLPAWLQFAETVTALLVLGHLIAGHVVLRGLVVMLPADATLDAVDAGLVQR